MSCAERQQLLDTELHLLTWQTASIVFDVFTLTIELKYIKIEYLSTAIESETL
jgi:hypothetical protein